MNFIYHNHGVGVPMRVANFAPNFPGFGPKYYQRKGAFAIIRVPLESKKIKINNQQYVIGTKIGKGGFGSVYNARRASDNGSTAVKVVSLATLDASEAMTCAESILTEIKMMRKLKAESFRQLIEMYDFDFHKDTGLAFIVMECGLCDLETKLAKAGRLNRKDRKVLWRQLVDIAVGLHTRNIVHRDIKPQNLLVFPNNEIKLIDLGIAKIANSEMTGPNGTNRYSGPEIIQPALCVNKGVTSKADSWSWGAILYRVVYLTPPWYVEPCSQPPTGRTMTRDSALADLLKKTLVIHPDNRLSPPQLAEHPYTTIIEQ